jgi:hypothetical protein
MTGRRSLVTDCRRHSQPAENHRGLARFGKDSCFARYWCFGSRARSQRCRKGRRLVSCLRLKSDALGEKRERMSSTETQ